MANTARRKDYIDRNDNMFIPMNVEGGVWNEHFITTPKLLAIVGMILTLVIIIGTLSSGDGSSWLAYVVYIGLWALASSYITRFFIFQEKFYYKMYKELEKYEITSPALFWEIQSIRDTEDGALITFGDARIAVIVKLDRDTITGKAPDFKETHYDAVSDFYRALATNKYSFVQMNVMEPAGKDPRLNELAKLVNKSDNPSVCKLMELQIGHIKNITNTALYESDYFLFYTYDMAKVDTIIDDISECIFKILDGAYIGYTFLDNKEIVELVKERYGVRYFNSTEASLMMFGDNAMASMNPFNITGIIWNDKNEQTLTKNEVAKLRRSVSEVIQGRKSRHDLKIKDIIYRKDEAKKIGIDLDNALESREKKIEDAKRKVEEKRDDNKNLFDASLLNNSDNLDSLLDDMSTDEQFDYGIYGIVDDTNIEDDTNIKDDTNIEDDTTIKDKGYNENTSGITLDKTEDISDENTTSSDIDDENIDFGDDTDVEDDNTENIDFGDSDESILQDESIPNTTEEINKNSNSSSSDNEWDDEIIDI